MGRSVLSSINALAAPIRIWGHRGRRAVLPRRCSPFRCTHFTSIFSTTFFRVKFVFSCMELHMGFLQRGHWLFVGFCCTLLKRFLQNVCPQSCKIIGSSIKVSLRKHEENMDFECTKFLKREGKELMRVNQRTQRKTRKLLVTRENATNTWVGLVLNAVGWDDGLRLSFNNRRANSDPKTVPHPRLL